MLCVCSVGCVHVCSVGGVHVCTVCLGVGVSTACQLVQSHSIPWVTANADDDC